jgi:glycine hydroxymethyltransferase
MALMKVGDTMLSLDLNSGGHLTHGAAFNFSGKLYKIIHYGLVKETEQLDYAQAEQLAKEHRPRLIVVGASAYPRIIDFPRFKQIADSCGASLMVDMAHIAGLVAGGVHPSPIPYADVVTTTTHKTLRGPRSGLILMKEQYAKTINSQVFPGMQGGPLMHVVDNAKALAEGLQGQGLRIVSGGTDNHLMLLDLRPKKVTGKLAEDVLNRAGITVNKNQIPFDPEKPTISSGVRVGTAAITTRGMQVPEMAKVAAFIGRALDHHADEAALQAIRSEVRDFTKSFPLYQSRLAKS